jgi:type I restriction enzyme R subunit
MNVKRQADEKVLSNSRMIQNEGYFSNFMSPIVIGAFEENGVELDDEAARNINKLATSEYLYQFNNASVW